MSSTKPRPPDGPGANGLRGGNNSYSLKTAMGGWIEDVGGAKEYKRGFTSKEFITECQHQQTGYNLKQSPEFGAGLPQRMALPRTSTEMFHPPSGPSTETWQTNTQVMIKRAGERYSEHSNHAPTPNLNPEELQKYRSSWTVDTAASRDMRYQTESRRAGNGGAPNSFIVNSIRLLPGSPVAFEKLREKLLERYGLLALTALRHSLGGKASLTGAELNKAIMKAGITTSRIEFNQILAFVTPKDTVLSDNFLRVFMGVSTVPYDNAGPLSVYRSICERAGKTCFSIEELSEELNVLGNAEVVDGLKVFLSAYDRGNGIDESGFVQLHADMYNSSVPSNAIYEEVFASLWK